MHLYQYLIGGGLRMDLRKIVTLTMYGLCFVGLFVTIFIGDTWPFVMITIMAVLIITMFSNTLADPSFDVIRSESTPKSTVGSTPSFKYPPDNPEPLPPEHHVVNPQPPKWQCKFCGKVFLDDMKLRRHIGRSHIEHIQF